MGWLRGIRRLGLGERASSLAALAGVVDTLILDTAGFGVFRDGEKLALLRRLAEKRGLIVRPLPADRNSRAVYSCRKYFPITDRIITGASRLWSRWGI